MSRIYQNTPALVDLLYARGIELEITDEDNIKAVSNRELTAGEVRAIKSRKPALLDTLRARASRELDRGEGVLPALRAYLSENPHTAHFEPEYVAENLYLQDYLSYRTDTGDVAGALEALQVGEEGVLA